jgi:hypothetical protein
MRFSEWVVDAAPRWVSRLPTPHVHGLPETILGEADAAAEWGGPQKPLETFVRIQTYNDFKQPRALYLFGRRGTGKTALIRMFDYEIKHGAATAFKLSWVVGTHSVLLELSAALSQSGLAHLAVEELADFLEPLWRWYITVSAMAAVCERPDLLRHYGDRIDPLVQYFRTVVPPDRADTPRDMIRNHLISALQDLGPETTLPAANRDVSSRLTTLEWSRANKRLTDVLSDHPCVVMLDSGEVYAVRSNVPRSIVTALIAAVNKLYVERPYNNLLAKAAFPTEILPYVFPYNQGKIEGNIINIFWPFSDIVTLIAKRYSRAVNGDHARAIASPLSYTSARRLLYNHLPPTVTTRLGVEWDTLSYVIRHTQRTPRQVILLLNAVLTAAREEGVVLAALSTRPDLIVGGVHARMNHLLQDALDMYRPLYPSIHQIVQRMLAQQQCYFQAKHLDRLAKNIQDLRRDQELSREQVKRILFEVGVLGLAQDIHRLRDGEHWVIEALFEYQIKDVLPVTNESWCVLHPMFYDWLQARIDETAFCYPVPFEPEEREVLGEHGVTAGQRR